MIDHAYVLENTDRYLAGDLTAVERERIELHLAACEACKQEVADALRLEQTMTGLFADARPSANLDDRIIGQLQKEPTRTLRRPTLWRFVGAAAAVLVVGLIGAAVQAMSGDGSSPLAKAFKQFEADYASTTFTTVGNKLGPSAFQEKHALFSKIVSHDPHSGKYASLNKILADNSFAPQIPIEPTPPAPEEQSRSQGLPNLKNDGKPGESKKERFGGELNFYGYTKDIQPTRVYYESKVLDDLENAAKKRKEWGFDGTDGKETPAMPTPGLPPPPRETVDPRLPEPVPTIVKPVTPAYFDTTPPPIFPPPVKPGDDSGEGKQGKGDKQGEGKPNEEKRKVPDAEPPKKEELKPDQKKKPLPADEPPLEVNRKIIRTGEMEFEIDSFSDTAKKITQLVTSVKGGYVATTDSERLPNKKVKGSIVLRMPPQFLDRFVLDLLAELAKTGHLRNQRIISLDVTKQYTDIESRLRAARTMEERLIQIIKIGKGEIKDLIAAERELGVWRTKIEEMEGEIRYYSNQVSLSTLTILLYEKEILAPTALVVSESVRMRIEVDDVAKAHKIAMDLVEKLDGRITRSELKQHMAGQLQSILCADIAPKHKDTFRDALKKLGLVSLHEENQSQHTEGGVGKTGALKPRQDDVHFDITMHNTANIAPSRSTDVKIVTTDVPAAYARLLDEIVKAGGQVRDGKLNEQDKLNVHAYLDFNVAPAKKPLIDKVLEEIGPVLERINMRAPINQLSSEGKFGYVLTLRDFASIPPSKSVVEVIAALDVVSAFAKLQEAISDPKVKAQIAGGTLNEQDKFNINARIEFTVFADKKAEVDTLLKGLGVLLSRTNMQAPLNQLSTTKKFGYTLTLLDYANVPASKAVELKLAVNDVPTTFAKLVEAIKAAKGKADAKLNEKDKQNITAQVVFSVPIEEKAGIEKLLIDLGTMLSRSDVEAPANKFSTDKKFGYDVVLRDFVTIDPSQLAKMTIASNNVASSYATLKEAITRAKGHIRVGKLEEKSKVNVLATIAFTIPSAEKPAFEKLLADLGTTLSRVNEQAPDKSLSTDGKFGYAIEMTSTTTLPPREKVSLKLEVGDVDARSADLKAIVVTAKGRVLDSGVEHHENGKAVAVLVFEVPAVSQDEVIRQMKGKGKLVSQASNRHPEIAENELTTSQLIVTLAGTNPIVPTDEGLGASVHKSLYLSFRILTGIVMALIVGLSALVPLALLIWIGFKVYAMLAGPNLQAMPELAPASGKLAADEEKPTDGDASAKG